MIPIINPNKMTDIDIQLVNEYRSWQPRWEVHLVHGDPETSGVIVETIHVTKKWERVEAAIEKLRQKSLTLPQHDHGEWFVQVYEMAALAYAAYTFPQPTNEELETLWSDYDPE